MKLSILIFSQAMELGGVERSLLGLLDSIDYDRYDVDLFLMRHSGELMPYLNPKANLLPEYNHSRHDRDRMCSGEHNIHSVRSHS